MSAVDGLQVQPDRGAQTVLSGLCPSVSVSPVILCPSKLGSQVPYHSGADSHGWSHICLELPVGQPPQKNLAKGGSPKAGQITHALAQSKGH